MGSVQEKIFRSAALARHASPEGLDTLLEITTVRGWISLLALSAIVAAGLIWGVLGHIPQVVAGQGIMVREGLYRAQTYGAGRIDSVLVNSGSEVKRGQTIAVLAQPELTTTIHQLERTLSELQANRNATAALLASNSKMQLASIAEQQKEADEAILAADQRLVYLNARIVNEQTAVNRGLMPPDALQNTVSLRAETQLQKLSTVARKQQLGASAVEHQVTSNQSLFSLDQDIKATSNRLDQAKELLAASATVVSPYDGTVIERLVDAGQAVASGTAVATVEPAIAPIEVLMFIPLEGKRIRENMRVEMVPGGVRPEETGYFIGHVKTVSAAPLSGSGLDRYLKNEVLVEQFTSQGGAYMVTVTVELDSATANVFNKYKWTSRKGAPLSFGSGTLVSGKIVVDQSRPISLVIPAIRRWFGG